MRGRRRAKRGKAADDGLSATRLVSAGLALGLTLAEIRRMPLTSLVMLVESRSASDKGTEPEVRDATQADIERFFM